MARFMRMLVAVLGLTAMGTLMYVEVADARVRGGIGSRGTRTFTPPPPTQTTPNQMRPLQRSTTPAQPSAAGRPAAQTTPGAAARPGLFNRPGFMGGMMAGLLGAGLFGLLLGQGLFGNLASFAAVLGLLLQLALIGGVAFLLLRWWQRRNQPQHALAGIPAGARHTLDAPPAGGRPDVAPRTGAAYGTGSYGTGSMGNYGHHPAQPSDEIGIKPEDYDAFERLLGDIQTAFSNEDVAALRERTTEEMLGYMSEDMAEHLSRGVAALVTNVKLLQGDLAEAWAEGSLDYATVAMRYELIDAVIDRKTRAVVEGDAERTVEATELWTFVRSRGGPWRLSAIHQADEAS